MKRRVVQQSIGPRDVGLVALDPDCDIRLPDTYIGVVQARDPWTSKKILAREDYTHLRFDNLSSAIDHARRMIRTTAGEILEWDNEKRGWIKFLPLKLLKIKEETHGNMQALF